MMCVTPSAPRTVASPRSGATSTAGAVRAVSTVRAGWVVRAVRAVWASASSPAADTGPPPASTTTATMPAATPIPLLSLIRLLNPCTPRMDRISACPPVDIRVVSRAGPRLSRARKYRAVNGVRTVTDVNWKYPDLAGTTGFPRTCPGCHDHRGTGRDHRGTQPGSPWPRITADSGRITVEPARRGQT